MGGAPNELIPHIVDAISPDAIIMPRCADAVKMPEIENAKILEQVHESADEVILLSRITACKSAEYTEK